MPDASSPLNVPDAFSPSHVTDTSTPSEVSGASSSGVPDASSPSPSSTLTSHCTAPPQASVFTSVERLASSSSPTVRVPSASKILAKIYPKSRATVEGSGIQKCPICEFATLRPHHFNRHILTHTGIKPFQCDFCDFKCARADALKQHKQTHVKENELLCRHCFCLTESKEDLKNHFLTNHTFICQQCYQVFPTLKKLRHHEGTHKAYKCRFCELTSIYAKKVERHERSTHGVVEARGAAELVFPVDLSMPSDSNRANNRQGTGRVTTSNNPDSSPSDIQSSSGSGNEEPAVGGNESTSAHFIGGEGESSSMQVVSDEDESSSPQVMGGTPQAANDSFVPQALNGYLASQAANSYLALQIAYGYLASQAANGCDTDEVQTLSMHRRNSEPLIDSSQPSISASDPFITSPIFPAALLETAIKTSGSIRRRS